MAKTYGLVEVDSTDCPECGTELEPIVLYGDIRLGCPDCIPDGLFESYALAENI